MRRLYHLTPAGVRAAEAAGLGVRAHARLREQPACGA